ncbi:hypothetical protein PG994_014569 [Apiospora phragmitis]|uniref:RNase H type-1 domain-containing protein n=1 Tax=Apiospora phragmitis TaxID=2905665 RepID=A0ABR1T4Q0_9PEZI
MQCSARSQSVPINLGSSNGGNITQGSSVSLTVYNQVACDLEPPTNPGQGKLSNFQLDTACKPENKFTMADAKDSKFSPSIVNVGFVFCPQTIDNLFVGIDTSGSGDITTAMGSFAPYPNVKYQIMPMAVFHVGAGTRFNVGDLVKAEMMANTMAVDFNMRGTNNVTLIHDSDMIFYFHPCVRRPHAHPRGEAPLLATTRPLSEAISVLPKDFNPDGPREPFCEQATDGGVSWHPVSQAAMADSMATSPLTVHSSDLADWAGAWWEHHFEEEEEDEDDEEAEEDEVHPWLMDQRAEILQARNAGGEPLPEDTKLVVQAGLASVIMSEERDWLRTRSVMYEQTNAASPPVWTEGPRGTKRGRADS